MTTGHDIVCDTAPATFKVCIDPRIDASAYRIAFVVLLDGDLVMSPEHVGVGLLAAVLRQAGFIVRIFEASTNCHPRTVEDIALFAPQFICFTLMSINIESCRRICLALSSRVRNATYVAGGPAATYAGDTVLAFIPQLSVLVIGEGEQTIVELIQMLVLGLPLTGCRGIMFRLRGGRPESTPCRPLLPDLDLLPYAARDQFEENGNHLEYLRISTTRGCTGQCSFCSAYHAGNRYQPGKVWRARSVQSVLNEVAWLVEHYNFRTFDFVDSTFEDPGGGLVGKQRVRQIAEGLLRLGVPLYYNCCMRAEDWSRDDHELLQLLFQSGLEKVNVGIEAGTEEELRLWGKRATVSDNVRIIGLLREHHIYLAMGFIQFHPYSTLQTLQANAQFIRDHYGHNLRRLTERLEVYPGTSIAHMLERDGLLDESYRTSLQHFAYRFKDERVAVLCRHFASLFNNQEFQESGVITEECSAYRFEVFNVVLETYISRTQRLFGEDPVVAELLQEFRAGVECIRRELADYNFNFFMANVAAVLEDRFAADSRARYLREIESVYASRMNAIRLMQLRFGKKVAREGIDLAQISSSIHLYNPAGAARPVAISTSTPK